MIKILENLSTYCGLQVGTVEHWESSKKNSNKIKFI